jgi:hypothetical protein
VVGNEQNSPAVVRCSADGDDKAAVFVGDPRSAGSDDRHLNNPLPPQPGP